MRIDVSEPEQCGCDTCVQHRTFGIFNTQETEPRNVIGSSFTSVPVSSGTVQALGDSSALGSTSTSSPSPIRSETATPLAAQSIDSTIFNWGVFNSKNAPVDASAASSTSSPVQSSSPTIFSFRTAVTPASSEPAQALGPTTSGSLPVPVFGSSPFGTSEQSIFGLSQAPVKGIFGSGASDASRPSIFGTMKTSTFGFGASDASTSSTSSPFDALSPLRWGSMQAPVQASAPNTSTPCSFLPAQDSGKTASAFPSLFSDRGGFARPNVGISPAISTPTPTRSFGETHFSSPFGPTQDFAKTGVCVPRIIQENTFGSSLPGSGVSYLSRYPYNLFGPNQQSTTPVSGRGSFLACVETEQGSRYPRYSPTLDGPDMYISISASNSHGHKSHEELRWEDYKNGDKGARPNTIFSSSTIAPSLFASPSIPDHLQRRTTGTTQGNMTGFPLGYTIQPAVTSSASGCTACGATSSSSSSGYLGFNVVTNPPSAATSLPGLFYSTSGYCPLMFGTPNLVALGTTTTLAVQAYPMILGTPILAAQGTTTPAVHPYPVMFGSPNLAAQGTAPAVQAYLGRDLMLLPFANMTLQ